MYNGLRSGMSCMFLNIWQIWSMEFALSANRHICDISLLLEVQCSDFRRNNYHTLYNYSTLYSIQLLCRVYCSSELEISVGGGYGSSKGLYHSHAISSWNYEMVVKWNWTQLWSWSLADQDGVHNWYVHEYKVEVRR